MDDTQQYSVNRRSVLKAAGGAAGMGVLGGIPGTAMAAHDDDDYKGVRVNQVGYPIDGTKIAIGTSQAMDVSSVSEFEVVDADTGDVVESGTVDGPFQDEAGTDHEVVWANFTDLDEPGEYQVHIGDAESRSFTVDEASEVYKEVLRDVGRLYTLHRSNTHVDDSEYTGLEYGPGHTQDEEAIVAEPATGDWLEDYEPGDTIDVGSGWYDAGDYGKYVNPAGVSVAMLMLAYERNPDVFHEGQFHVDDVVDDDDWGEMPDVLVEAKEELRFLEQMQRPNGSLFYKLAANEWPPMEEKPEDSDRDRYVLGTSSAGTAMACGAFAMAARVFEDYDPEFAGRMLENAEHAFEWLDDNPEVVWEESQMEHPEEGTVGQDNGSGRYGREDMDAPDRFWAAAELLRTTDDPSYDEWIQNQELTVSTFSGDEIELPGNVSEPIDWDNPVALGNYAYFWADEADPERRGEGDDAHEQDDTAAAGLNGAFWVNLRYVGDEDADEADRWMTGTYDYYWGHVPSGLSRGVQSHWAVEMHREIWPWDADDHWIYDENAELISEPLHHALGRSPTGYSLSPTHGEKSTRNPHDRILQSHKEADGYEGTMPGMMVGGGHNDNLPTEGDCTLDHIEPDTQHLMAYTDQHCSYATNEWAINYTGPLFMLLAELIDEVDDTPEPDYDWEAPDGGDDDDDDDDDDSECPVGEGETLSNGNTVCDIDGDGKYRDLTASGDTTTQDLQYFFENQHREPYDSRTDLFDFTGNGDVGQPDVVDLFHAI